MKKTKIKLFTQPTKIGTEIYAYNRYENEKIYDRLVFDIVHLNLQEEEEFLKGLSFARPLDSEIEKVVYDEVNIVTDIFDIGAETGQKRLKQGLNS